MYARSKAGSCWTLLMLLLVLGPVARSRAQTSADRKEVILHSRAVMAEAHTVFARGQADSALAMLDDVIRQDAANPDAYYLKGLIKLSCADTAGAEASLVEGTRVAPLSRRIKLLLARVRIEAGKIDEAEEIVNGVMALRPKDFDCRYLQGLIALARADTTEAITIWESTLAEKLGGGR